jgi:acid phosphatase family membrane protein YuiD
MRGVEEQKLRELLGHTPVEVLVGAVLGIAVGLLL